MTEQGMIRELNKKGVIWTDYKPQNFDIVPDPDGPLGYKVILFDRGGFYPEMNPSGPESFAKIRDVQQKIDAITTREEYRDLLENPVINNLDLRPFGNYRPVDEFGFVTSLNKLSIRSKEMLNVRTLKEPVFENVLKNYAKSIGADVSRVLRPLQPR